MTEGGAGVICCGPRDFNQTIRSQVPRPPQTTQYQAKLFTKAITSLLALRTTDRRVFSFSFFLTTTVGQLHPKVHPLWSKVSTVLCRCLGRIRNAIYSTMSHLMPIFPPIRVVCACVSSPPSAAPPLPPPTHIHCDN